MKRLMQFEFYKLIRQKSFYICTIILLASAVLSMVATKVLTDALGEQYATSPATAVLSRVDDTFTMLCGIFVALLVCGDFSQQTIKNVYARGFSKAQMYFAKFAAALFGAFIMFVLNYAVSFLFGVILFGGIEVDGKMAYDMAAQLCTVFAFTAFAFMVSFIFRKTGAGVALAILGPTIVNIVLMLVSMIARVERSFSEYWISGILTKLSGASADNLTEITDTWAEGTLTYSDITLCLMLSLVYTAVFLFIGYYVNKKKDG